MSLGKYILDHSARCRVLLRSTQPMLYLEPPASIIHATGQFAFFQSQAHDLSHHSWDNPAAIE